MRILLLWMLLVGQVSYGQEKSAAKLFLEKFKNLEGKYFEGEIVAGGREGAGCVGQKLMMEVMSYSDREVRIPFCVGEDKSRTWILSYANNVLTLKHDHRHEDGAPDEVTLYGRTATNSGWDTLQMFPADVETCQLIDYACQNVWWITMDGDTFTYTLRRIRPARWFSVKFDLAKAVRSHYRP